MNLWIKLSQIILKLYMVSKYKILVYLACINQFTILILNCICLKPKRFTSNKRIDGKVVVITGGNSGIGRETVKALVRRGAQVIMGCRDITSGTELIDQLREENSEYELIVMPLDLSSLASVRQFAQMVCERQTQIDLLINNAGIMDSPKVITSEGFELHFVTNYLAHFLLTLLLVKQMKSSMNARIVNVSSILHYFGNINLKDVNYIENYSELKAYTQSKLAQILFTRQLAKRLNKTNITTYVVNPGMVRTRLSRYLTTDLTDSRRSLKYFRILTKLAMSKSLTPEQGAQTTLYCALSDKISSQSGHYYSNCKRVVYLANKAIDDQIAEQLWDKSCYLVKLEEDYRL